MIRPPATGMLRHGAVPRAFLALLCAVAPPELAARAQDPPTALTTPEGQDAKDAKDGAADAVAAPLPSADLSLAFERAVRSFVKVQITPRGMSTDVGSERPSVVSGFAVDAEGLIVTIARPLDNAHAIVIENADGRVQLADVVGVNEAWNVALLRVAADAAVVPEFMPARTLRPAQPILGIGNPYDLGVTASVGHVMALDRSVRSDDYEWWGLVQVSLALHPGEQGGPLVDARGRVVGMVMTRLEHEEAEAQPHSISFALPIEHVMQIVAEVKERAALTQKQKKDRVPRPFLGIRALDIRDPALLAQGGLKQGEGCLVEHVFPGTAAESAGLRAFDILKSIQGRVVRGTLGLGESIMACPIGERVELLLIREGAEVRVSVVLGALP